MYSLTVRGITRALLGSIAGTASYEALRRYQITSETTEASLIPSQIAQSAIKHTACGYGVDEVRLRKKNRISTLLLPDEEVTFAVSDNKRQLIIEYDQEGSLTDLKELYARVQYAALNSSSYFDERLHGAIGAALALAHFKALIPYTPYRLAFTLATVLSYTAMRMYHAQVRDSFIGASIPDRDNFYNSLSFKVLQNLAHAPEKDMVDESYHKVDLGINALVMRTVEQAFTDLDFREPTSIYFNRIPHGVRYGFRRNRWLLNNPCILIWTDSHERLSDLKEVYAVSGHEAIHALNYSHFITMNVSDIAQLILCSAALVALVASTINAPNRHAAGIGTLLISSLYFNMRQSINLQAARLSREQEREADLLSVGRLGTHEALKHHMEKIAVFDDAHESDALATHPTCSERIKYIERASKKNRQPCRFFATPQFREMQQEMDDLQATMNVIKRLQGTNQLR